MSQLSHAARQARYTERNRDEINARARVTQKALRIARVEQGICTAGCGQPVISGLRVCAKHREQQAAKGRGRYQGVRHRKRKYGLTPEAYADLLASQGNRCAICDKAFNLSVLRSVAIDHDHVTGEVRGALCPLCNVAIGLLSDDPDRLERAAKYLRAARTVRLEVAH